MGYTSVANREEAVQAASELLDVLDGRAVREGLGAGDDAEIVARFPHVVDQIAAEAGIIAPLVCARAFAQAQGDLARAVSLVRAWSAMLPRLASARTRRDEWEVLRRITPAYAEPRGGQYLGASRDYEQRLLVFEAGDERIASRETDARANGAATHANGSATRADGAAVTPRLDLAPASAALSAEGLLGTHDRAEAIDITRAAHSKLERGPFLQLLARAETGGLTALAYAGIRGHGQRQDPTLVELRSGSAPVRVTRPDTGGSFVVGRVMLTFAEIALYALHENGEADAAFTLGVGVAPGRGERRAIAAAMLDAATTRAGVDPEIARPPYDDREFIALAVDGQEAAGFVEHLKLPHHVTFASDLDRVRAAREESP